MPGPGHTSNTMNDVMEPVARIDSTLFPTPPHPTQQRAMPTMVLVPSRQWRPCRDTARMIAPVSEPQPSAGSALHIDFLGGRPLGPLPQTNGTHGGKGEKNAVDKHRQP